MHELNRGAKRWAIGCQEAGFTQPKVHAFRRSLYVLLAESIILNLREVREAWLFNSEVGNIRKLFLPPPLSPAFLWAPQTLYEKEKVFQHAQRHVLSLVTFLPRSAVVLQSCFPKNVSALVILAVHPEFLKWTLAPKRFEPQERFEPPLKNASQNFK